MNTLLAKLCSHLDLNPEHTALLDERDTSDVWRQFAIWLLVGPDDGVIRFTKPGSLQYKAIQQVAQLYINDCKDIKMWQEVKSAAWSAAAWDAPGASAWSAKYASAAAAAFYAAAASAAADAAWSAYYAADAAWSAYYAAGPAADPASAAHYERMADKLIELINAAPMITTNK